VTPIRESRPDHDARGRRFAIVASRFNAALVERLVVGATAVLEARGAGDEDIELLWVPGSFELPIAARWLAASERFDAVLAFGVLIEGETEHFRLVAEAATHGLQRVALDTGVPVLHGVLAVHDLAQAEARAGGDHNRGAEVALAAVTMANLYHAQRAGVRS
jgi:6,7-dimethyl-8-ribityllumazine synthase